MTIPVFSKTVLTANTMTLVGQVPANIDFATITVNALNRGTEVTKVKFAVGNGTVPVEVDYIDDGSIVPENGGLFIRSCVLVPSGSNVFVEADKDGVVVNFSGLCQEIITQ